MIISSEVLRLMAQLEKRADDSPGKVIQARVSGRLSVCVPAAGAHARNWWWREEPEYRGCEEPECHFADRGALALWLTLILPADAAIELLDEHHALKAV